MGGWKGVEKETSEEMIVEVISIWDCLPKASLSLLKPGRSVRKQMLLVCSGDEELPPGVGLGVWL